MPRVSDHLEKSAIRLVRQSTTVPNTSNTSAFTADKSDMLAPCFFLLSFRGARSSYLRCAIAHRGISNSGFDAAHRPGMTASIEVEFLQLAVLGLDVTHRTGDRTHHHGLDLDYIHAELDARQQRAGGDAGCGKQAVAPRHVLDAVNHARVVDAHLGGALALLLAVEDQPTLHLAADAAQRHRRQHALRRAAGADIHVDAGVVRIGTMDHAGDIAVGDETDRSPSAAHAIDNF